MTDIRERMFAVARGERPDKVPFVQYDNNGGPNEEVWRLLGPDSMGVLRWTNLHSFEHTHCGISSETVAHNGQRIYRNTMETPVGSLIQERVDVPGIPGVTSIHKHYIQDIADYAILKEYLADIHVVQTIDAFDTAEQELGNHGFPHVSVGRTPFQQLWIEWVGLTELSFHLVDNAEPVMECAELMGRCLLQAVELVADVAKTRTVPYLIIGDNISAPIIGRDRFSEFCVPYYQKSREILDPVDVPLFVHMDGDLLDLSDLIATSGVQGLDSMSPPPDNDTSVADAVKYWPGMRLLINFPSSVHVASESVIYQTAMDIIQQGSDSCPLQIQISENPPPGAWKKSYPAIVKAILDSVGKSA